jgi:hypothetical protein
MVKNSLNYIVLHGKSDFKTISTKKKNENSCHRRVPQFTNKSQPNLDAQILIFIKQKQLLINWETYRFANNPMAHNFTRRIKKKLMKMRRLYRYNELVSLC